MSLSIQDQMLKAYIDKIFDKYDTDKSGTLDENQMTYFFNDLFKSLGMGTSVTKQQSLEAIKSIDQNYDGGVDKKQLFDAFRMMLNKPQQPQMPMTQSYPSYPHQNQWNNPYTPAQHNPYGMYNPYNQPPPQYNPYMQPHYPQGPSQYNPYNQGPYNGYGYGGYQNPPYNPYNPNNQGNMGSNMGGSLDRSKGGQWGKMQ